MHIIIRGYKHELFVKIKHSQIIYFHRQNKQMNINLFCATIRLINN